MKVGDLVLIHKDEQWGFHSNQIAIVVGKKKTKKTWHRVYNLLCQTGHFVSVMHDCDLVIEVLSVCDSEKTCLKRV